MYKYVCISLYVDIKVICVMRFSVDLYVLLVALTSGGSGAVRGRFGGRSGSVFKHCVVFADIHMKLHSVSEKLNEFY